MLRRYLAVLLVGLSQGVPTSTTPPSIAPREPIQLGGPLQLNSSLHSLTSQMLSGLSQERAGNIVFSPFSLHTVLSMLYAGSDGNTREDLSSLLGLNGTDVLELKTEYGDLLRNYSKLIDQLGTNIEVANAIYTSNDFRLREEYRRDVAKYFLAKVESLDFTQAALATQEINDWVKNKTVGFIQDFLPESAISDDTKSVIINGVYFKASWLYPFEKTRNFVDRFFTSENVTKDVEYMQTNEVFGAKYDKNLGCETISLPYLDEDYHMLIFKPDNVSMMNRLVADFDKLNLIDIHEDLERFHSKPVILEMPKFNVSYKASLMETLKNLGVSKLDNFSHISEDELYVSEFLHAAKIVVNEEGSEVAAVSGAVLDVRSAGSPRVTILKLNSPFLFVILDTSRSIPLIAGRIQSPSESEVVSVRNSEKADQTQVQRQPSQASQPLNRETAISGDCSPPCENGGNCAAGVCVCSDGFEGAYCQYKVTDCWDGTQAETSEGDVVFPCAFHKR